MTQLSPTALEAAAKAVFEQSIYHGYNDEVKAREWTRTSDLHRIAATAAITAYLAQAEKEGWVMVPRDTFYEIANRASNMSDPDAADWLPSIYRIACDAVGTDPWPMLRAAGYNPESLTVSALAQNGGE